VDIICLLIGLYQLVLLARVILSWIPAPPDALRPVVRFIYALTEPLIRLARPLIPPLRIGAVALDLSIILIFVGLYLLELALCTGRSGIF